MLTGTTGSGTDGPHGVGRRNWEYSGSNVLHRLTVRLQRLEARTSADWSWSDCYARVSKLARTMLPQTDEDVLDTVIALRRERGYNAWTSAHRLIWDRWRAAFNDAVEKLQISCSMLAG